MTHVLQHTSQELPHKSHDLRLAAPELCCTSGDFCQNSEDLRLTSQEFCRKSCEVSHAADAIYDRNKDFTIKNPFFNQKQTN